MNYNSDKDFLQLFNKISEMEGSNLIEKILDFCETYGQDVHEIGDFLEENKEFKKLLYNDCVVNNIIKNPEYKEFINRVEEIEEW